MEHTTTPNYSGHSPEQRNGDPTVDRILPLQRIATTDENLTFLTDLNKWYNNETMRSFNDIYNASRAKGSVESKRFGATVRGSVAPADLVQRRAQYARDRSQTQMQSELSRLVDEDYIPTLDPSLANRVDDPEYDQFKDALVAVATMTEDEWLGTVDQNGTVVVPGAIEGLRTAVATAPTAPDVVITPPDPENTPPAVIDTDPVADPDVVPPTPESGAEVLTLDELARRKHEAYNKKITGSSFGRRRRENMAAYETAEAAYLEALERDLDQKIADLDPDMPEADRHAAISRLVNERATADDALQYDLLINSGSKRQRKMKKILAEYSGWSTKKKVLVGLGLGAGSFAAGFGLGLVAGAAGTVAAGVVAGKIGFSTFRTYYSRLSQNYHAPAETTGFEYQATDVTFGDQLRTFMATTSRERIVSAEKVKKNATLWALGGLAVGATAASAGGILGTLQHTGKIDAPLTGNTWEGHSTPTNDHWKAGYLEHPFSTNNEAAALLGGNGNSGGNVISPTVEVGSSNAAEHALQAAHEKTSSVFNPQEYVHDNNVDMTIHRGEGGYSLLQKHFDGVTHSEAVKAWPEMAKDLDKKYPDFFYKHGSEWRIHMPSNGKLPTGLAEDMSQYLHDHDMLGGASGAAAEHASGAGSIGRGEGIISELHQRGMESVSQADVNTVGAALVKEGSGYADARIGGYGILYDASTTDHTAAGHFTPGAEKIFADMADDGKLNGSVVSSVDASSTAPDATPSSANPNSLTGSDYNGSDLLGIKAALDTNAGSLGGVDWKDMDMDITKISGYIQRGDINALNADIGLQNTLNYVQKDLANIKYTNSTVDIIARNPNTGRWMINPMPEGSRLPSNVMSLIEKYRQAIDTRAA